MCVYIYILLDNKCFRPPALGGRGGSKIPLFTVEGWSKDGFQSVYGVQSVHCRGGWGGAGSGVEEVRNLGFRGLGT